MNVVFEFLGSEPIENVITCMHFKIDKVVFFGYQREIVDKKDCTELFLKNVCHVKKVSFYSLSQDDLQSVLKCMKDAIEQEKESGSNLYFDITGGESLILVAFGILSKENDTPMHMFDIPKDKLIELNEGASRTISLDVERNDKKFDLNTFIMLRGAKINEFLHKDSKEGAGPEFESDVAHIWKVAKDNYKYWNAFSNFLAANFVPDDEMHVNCSAKRVISAINNSSGNLKKIKQLNLILDQLGASGMLLNVVHRDGIYSFDYKDINVCSCLREGGSILELLAYINETKNSDDAQVGVHIDWDGEIHYSPIRDVLNEVDVLKINGNIITFISCKSGKMSAPQVLHALYELDTVASRFGGKYAKKILVTMNEIGDIYKERAEEMNIEVKNYTVE